MPYAPRQKCQTPRCSNLVESGYCYTCQQQQLSDTRMTIVAGPPCSGKTTYVAEHKKENDLVIDLDALQQALGSDNTHGHNPALLPFALEARDAIINRLGRPHDLNHVWIIRTAPTNKERRQWWQANVIVLETPKDVCHARADANRPPLWHDLIDAWWEKYEPNPSDKIINAS